MSQIKGKNTSPEILVFRYLRHKKIYFQKHYTKVPGSPDIALPRKKRVIFIDGDFWHGYTLERRKDTLPMFWTEKIIRNVKRDRRYRRALIEQGWEVMRIWEHELSKKDRDETLQRIVGFLTKPKRPNP
jgi:DNA mismatch endonuclease (patch repair protein)